jgi:hypothetical protein
MGVKTMNIPSLRRPTDGPDDHELWAASTSGTSTTDRADRAAAAERYDAFVSGGGEASPPCPAFDDPAHDFDRCGITTVDHPRLFVQEVNDADEINVHDVRQAGVGDCYFMATLSALAGSPQGRAIIRNAIAENRNDRGDVVSYTVTLHRPETHWWGLGKTTFSEVRVTVDAQFAEGHANARSDGNANEIWPLVLEKAYARFRGGYNAIGHGGVASDAMKVLTGRDASETVLGHFYRYGPGDLQNDLAAGNLVVLGTPRDVHGYNLLGNHAYVVTGTIERDGRLYVTLHNPWDSSEPTPVPVDEIGQRFRTVDVGSVR